MVGGRGQGVNCPTGHAILDVRMPDWNGWKGRDRPWVMGIVNVTPDSFSPGGRYLDPEAAAAHALRLEAEGADLIDVGGESTRPGAAPVSAREELRRVLPVLAALQGKLSVPISIDTTKAEVAEESIKAGAQVVNDISALRFDPEMGPLVARTGVGVILMHMQGTPQTMQDNPTYADVVDEVRSFLAARAQAAVTAGVAGEQVAVDPGIGFGKTVEHNLDLLRRLPALVELGLPVVVGPSRKSFIGAVLGLPVDQRLEGTLAACAVAVARGADVVRVHDVAPVRRVVDMAVRLRNRRET